MTDIFGFVEGFRTELWPFISNLLILVSTITVISTLVTWFMIESIEKVFIKKAINKVIKWIISTIVVFSITYLLVVLFRSLEMNLATLYYILLIGSFALATTMLAYLKGIKPLFKLTDIVDVKVDTLMINEKEAKLEAQNNLLKTKIIRDQLIITKEVDDAR